MLCKYGQSEGVCLSLSHTHALCGSSSFSHFIYVSEIAAKRKDGRSAGGGRGTAVSVQFFVERCTLGVSTTCACTQWIQLLVPQHCQACWLSIERQRNRGCAAADFKSAAISPPPLIVFVATAYPANSGRRRGIHCLSFVDELCLVKEYWFYFSQYSNIMGYIWCNGLHPDRIAYILVKALSKEKVEIGDIAVQFKLTYSNNNNNNTIWRVAYCSWQLLTNLKHLQAAGGISWGAKNKEVDQSRWHVS